MKERSSFVRTAFFIYITTFLCGISLWASAFLLASQPPAKPVEEEKAKALIRREKTSFGKMEAGNATAPETKGGHAQIDKESLSRRENFE